MNAKWMSKLQLYLKPIIVLGKGIRPGGRRGGGVVTRLGMSEVERATYIVKQASEGGAGEGGG